MFTPGSPQRIISQQGTQAFLRTVERGEARSFRDKVATLFKSNPMQWIDGLEIAEIGGAYASRTRISECRKQLGMRIENRQRKVRIDYGEPDEIHLSRNKFCIVSEYRYLPPQGQQELFEAGR